MGERSKLEVEAETARGILLAMRQDIADLERWWAPSKRGSNAQRALDSIKQRIDAAVRCLEDGLVDHD